MIYRNQTCTTILCSGHPALTRRAKYLIKLMKSLVPDDTLTYVECELCAETRNNQNQMAEAIFAILVGSYKLCTLDNSRLELKVNELAQMLISCIDPFRLDQNE